MADRIALEYATDYEILKDGRQVGTDVRDRRTRTLFLNLLQQQKEIFWHIPFGDFRLNLRKWSRKVHQGDGYCTRTLWKYFFPPEKYSLHFVCASARCISYSVFVLG